MMCEAPTDDAAINKQGRLCAWARVANIVPTERRQTAPLASKTGKHGLVQCGVSAEVADVALCGTAPDKVVHLSLYRPSCPPAAVAAVCRSRRTPLARPQNGRRPPGPPLPGAPPATAATRHGQRPPRPPSDTAAAPWPPSATAATRQGCRPPQGEDPRHSRLPPARHVSIDYYY